MKRTAQKAHQQAYDTFIERFRPVTGNPMHAVLEWKKLYDAFKVQYDVVLASLELSIEAVNNTMNCARLDDSARISDSFSLLKRKSQAVLYAQLSALDKAWADTYETLAQEGEFVITKELVVGKALIGTLDSLDETLSGSVLCVLEKAEYPSYIGGPVLVGDTVGYLQHTGLSATPDGRAHQMPVVGLVTLELKLR